MANVERERPMMDGIDMLALAVDALRAKPGITDEELAKVLGFRRAASARFWRLKAYYVVYGFYPNR